MRIIEIEHVSSTVSHTFQVKDKTYTVRQVKHPKGKEFTITSCGGTLLDKEETKLYQPLSIKAAKCFLSRALEKAIKDNEAIVVESQ